MYIIKVRTDRNLRSLIRNMTRIRDEMMHLTRPVLSPSHAGWTPDADIYETDQDVIVVVNLAGVQKEDIEVSYHENLLRVVGNRARVIPEGENAHFHHMEIGNGEFERVFRIPVAIDADLIRATYVDGLLTVNMRKRPVNGGVQVNLRS
ncbi:MAG: Hsp20/alpha crystallin family protein [Deltaproteobacteria bacterium]|nr:Hsp20/alpha crystallin family protein [Deltaproteobacteria bacterium]